METLRLTITGPPLSMSSETARWNKSDSLVCTVCNFSGENSTFSRTMAKEEGRVYSNARKLQRYNTPSGHIKFVCCFPNYNLENHTPPASEICAVSPVDSEVAFDLFRLVLVFLGGASDDDGSPLFIVDLISSSEGAGFAFEIDALSPSAVCGVNRNSVVGKREMAR